MRVNGNPDHITLGLGLGLVRVRVGVRVGLGLRGSTPYSACVLLSVYSVLTILRHLRPRLAEVCAPLSATLITTKPYVAAR